MELPPVCLDSPVSLHTTFIFPKKVLGDVESGDWKCLVIALPAFQCLAHDYLYSRRGGPPYPTGEIHILSMGLYSFLLHKHLKWNFILKNPFKLTCYVFTYLV